MDSTAAEGVETNSVDSSIPEPPTKETGVSEGVNSANELIDNEKTVSSDKELSWEKIAAEVTSDDEVKLEENQNVNENKKSEPRVEINAEPIIVESEGEKIEETVISSVTEEKITTESESNEVIPDSTQQSDEVVEEPSLVTEEVDSTTEPKENEKEVVVVETTIEEMTEVSIETIPVEDVVEETVTEDVPLAQPEPETSEKAKEEGIIEISEIKDDEETTGVTETVDEIEYTVVEADEVETNEIIEEHLAQTNNTSETVVIINPDHTQTEITIEQVEDSDKANENSQTYTEEIYLVTKEDDVDDPSGGSEVKQKPKKQRGRKPIADIPLHVLGRDITKPTEGVSNGGRTMPKPRLGVKVPYRNLTSQIVSKQEIEKEIMERFKLKQEQNTTNSGDILFARKLTQRLAKKLIPSEKDKTTVKPEEPSSSVEKIEKPVSEIKNNSDLIAILEGDADDIELIKQKQAKEEEEMKVKARRTEKEIALQQLKELPGKGKVLKTKVEEEKKVPSPQKEVPKAKPVSSVTSPKICVPEKKNQIEVEPRLKTGMVIKTYTRKRKSTDSEPIPPPKKAVITTTPTTTVKTELSDVYITKSSRVIKRKVIWDPDEVPTKSPLKSPKSEPPIKLATPVKTAEKKEVVEKKVSAEKNQEKKVAVEKAPDKKISVEKSPEKKASVEKPQEKKVPAEKIQEKKVASPVKKVISKTPPPKKPKRLTEVDRLLMDEGAVNMLYDVKTNEETSPEKLKKKNNKSVISLDKAHKELMSKTNVIKNDLQQNTNKEVQKSLRKKEGTSPPKKDSKETTPSAVTRKKSKDSVRSSVHSPPASPPYNAAEASRIIRRHSSSSFSSNDEFNDDEERTTRKKSSASVESPKKKMKKSSDSKPAKEVVKNNNNTVTEPKVNHADKTGQSKLFTTTKKNKLVTIKLHSVDTKCYFNEEVLKELTSSLKELAKDDDCHVVSITSDSNESFCEGLDYRLVTADEDGTCKKKATELASSVKEFLRCLLHFPKVLVAGIQGDCVGLGVTMLPLFDMVVSSDTSTFSAPYARLGSVPEAGFLLTVPHLGSNGLASELLYTSQIIKADDAFRRGLVTRLCWPEKYQQELKSILSQIANQSRQSLLATKQQLRQNILQSTDAALNSMNKVLVENWTSSECQKNFSK